MEENKPTYSKISECGTYGFKPYGPHTTGGELWGWIDTEEPQCLIEDLWHVDEMDEVINEFRQEMADGVASLWREMEGVQE